VTITAAIAASDDTDAAPRITLLSIVSNKARAGRDVAGATLGTDDRQFAVRARPGAIYTVTYRATDAAGNSTVATATVEVRRPRRSPRDGHGHKED